MFLYKIIKKKLKKVRHKICLTQKPNVYDKKQTIIDSLSKPLPYLKDIFFYLGCPFFEYR